MSLAALVNRLSKHDGTEYQGLVSIENCTEELCEPRDYDEGLVYGFLKGEYDARAASVSQGIENGIFYAKQRTKQCRNKVYFAVSLAASFISAIGSIDKTDLSYAAIMVAGVGYAGLANKLRKNEFSTKGIYSIHRNPEVFGENVAAMGVAFTFASGMCANGNYVASLLGALTALLYIRANHISVQNEEREFSHKEPTFRDYVRNVPRYIPIPFRRKNILN